MYFKQFYLGCLAHASYLIGSDGEAAVVDPQRDVDQYVEEARRQGMKIKYVVETHLHADFVSGHHELAERTGAQIVFGAQAGVRFAHVGVRDGDLLKIGKVDLRILHTPGHAGEHFPAAARSQRCGQADEGANGGHAIYWRCRSARPRRRQRIFRGADGRHALPQFARKTNEASG